MDDDKRYNDPYADQKPVVTNKAPVSESRYAVISLVLGVLSFLGCCLYGFGGVFIGIIGIVFSIIALTKHQPNQGMAIAGLITSILGFILGGIVMVLVFIGIAL